MAESYSDYTIYRTTSDAVIEKLNDCKNLSSLTVLSCDRFTNVNITDALLTNPLEHLEICRCPVTEIPSIPRSVKCLILRGTNITRLPRLPANLKYLDISNTRLTNLPELPADLRYLDVSNTLLTKLPELPDSLVNLNIEGTQIYCLQNIPIHLRILNVVNTKLNLNIYRLPRNMYLIETTKCITSFQDRGNGYECDSQDYPYITRFSNQGYHHFKYYCDNLTSDNMKLMLNHMEIN